MALRAGTMRLRNVPKPGRNGSVKEATQEAAVEMVEGETEDEATASGRSDTESDVESVSEDGEEASGGKRKRETEARSGTDSDTGSASEDGEEARRRKRKWEAKSGSAQGSPKQGGRQGQPPKADAAKKRRHACDICGLRFLKPAHVKQHRLAHGELKLHACPQDGCDAVYKRRDHLNRHMLLHQGTLFQCPHAPACRKTFSTKANVIRHIRKFHKSNAESPHDTGTSKGADCMPPADQPVREVGGGCSRKQSQQQEPSSGGPLGSPCDGKRGCERDKGRASARDEAQPHAGMPAEGGIANTRDKARPHAGMPANGGGATAFDEARPSDGMPGGGGGAGFMCGLCLTQFEARALLEAHMRSKHRTVRCAECGRSISHTRYKRHMRERHTGAGLPEYPCPYQDCAKPFNTKWNLLQHVQAVHRRERPFVCAHADCLMEFSCKGSLKRHTAVRHPPRTVFSAADVAADDWDSISCSPESASNPGRAAPPKNKGGRKPYAAAAFVQDLFKRDTFS